MKLDNWNLENVVRRDEKEREMDVKLSKDEPQHLDGLHFALIMLLLHALRHQLRYSLLVVSQKRKNSGNVEHRRDVNVAKEKKNEKS